jgi:alkyl sulfatase BDS1-like metallo-beta-lactamase superfamily hydrolase
MEPPLYRSRPGGFDIQPAHQEKALEIEPGIYLSEGLSNTFLVDTREGRVIINTGMGFETPVHRRNFDAISSAPVRFILLTQGHVDHVGGIDQYLEAGTEVIAQAGNRVHQEDDRRIARFRAGRSAFAFAEAIGRAQRFVREHIGDVTPGQSVAAPTIPFDDEYTFELGGERFELLATPGGETTDSMVIWMPERKICFCGNLFSALFGHFPNLVTIRGDRYRDPLRFVSSLERVLALEPELLLVGHHQPVRGAALIKRELERIRDAVLYVNDATVDGMNAGKSVHTLMEEIELPPELEVGQGYGRVSWSVRAIWETYAGWFHGQSTTELYPVPQASVHEDLVSLAGGPDALAQRAAQRLEADEPLHAIHLAEIALNAVPGHPASVRVSRAAHERLLERSENFWESSWLKKCINELKALESES